EVGLWNKLKEVEGAIWLDQEISVITCRMQLSRKCGSMWIQVMGFRLTASHLCSTYVPQISICEMQILVLDPSYSA
ncbi:hypothetical protein HAX54_028526, partial [Datura stramonium]|nr:hypothetical protein [Datura stramonium]